MRNELFVAALVILATGAICAAGILIGESMLWAIRCARSYVMTTKPSKVVPIDEGRRRQLDALMKAGSR